eukprot:TRINITY_DN7740_c0_g1_i1.p1 TRINITY_DN7740_c0_g1~~TRINITY_DN7740_c0_g1_i1.p1  ORF type:complete len:2004 (-),score=471.94 TRINITY_DN7740_c0_g1_i1:42-5480(-)
MTGHDTAIHLLRQCWQNEPYTFEEWQMIKALDKVDNVSQCHDTVKLLLRYLLSESQRLLFLYPGQDTRQLESVDLRDSYWKTKMKRPSTSLLTAQEEIALFGKELSTVEKVSKGHLRQDYFHHGSMIFFSPETFQQVEDFQCHFMAQVRMATFTGASPQAWSEFKDGIPNLFVSLSQGISRQEVTPACLSFMAHHLVSVKMLSKNDLFKHGYPLLQLLYLQQKKMTEASYLDSQNRVVQYKGSLYLPVPSDPHIRKKEVTEIIDTVASLIDVPTGADQPEANELDSKSQMWFILNKECLKAGIPKEDNLDRKFFLELEEPTLVWNITNYSGKAVKVKHKVRWVSDALTRLEALYRDRKAAHLMNLYLKDLAKAMHWGTLAMASAPPIVWAGDLPVMPLYNTPHEDWPLLEYEDCPELELTSDRRELQWFDDIWKSLLVVTPGEEVEDTHDPQRALLEEKLTQDLLKKRITLAHFTKQMEDLEKQAHLAKREEEWPLQHLVHSDSEVEEVRTRMLQDWKYSCQENTKQSKMNAGTTLSPDLFEKMQYLHHQLCHRIDLARSQLEHILWNEGASQPYWQALLCIGRLSDGLRRPSAMAIIHSLKSEDVSHINPSVMFNERVMLMILHWVLLLVCHTRVARIQEISHGKNLSDPGVKAQLVMELSSHRAYDLTLTHWLFFEVENRVAIRPIQIKVAQEMLNNRNQVLQLNMGEGKSKVIIPLLCCADQNRDQDEKELVRINVLSSQFGEVRSYLQRVLGGLLQKRVYIFPFKRKVKLSERHLQILHQQMIKCRESGGIILTTPESRMSFYLKWCETLYQGGSASPLHYEKILWEPVTEILDESDEILRHKYQLIYTLGSQQHIDGLSDRWRMSLAIMRCLFMASLPAEEVPPSWQAALPHLQHLREALSQSEYCFFHCRERGYHSFPQFRILKEEFMTQLLPLLWKVIQHDPHCLTLFGHLSNSGVIQDYVLNRFSEVEDTQFREAHRELPSGNSRASASLQTLRGLFSFDILKMAFMKRHRIDFGIDKPDKMAVPFRAKDTPAEGVEFGHADVAILLTGVAYASAGLSASQTEACLHKLKTMGSNEQKEMYRRWYHLSKEIMSEEDVEALSSVDAINMANVKQLQNLHEYYRLNFEVISFFLDHFVFPKETKQFPAKIMASAWNIAEGDRVVGFSGTDDTKFTLPNNIKQQTLPELASTNGKMISKLADNNLSYLSVEAGLTASDILENMCRTDDWHVMIDCGALIEGMTNQEVVQRVLTLRRDFGQGIFFDEQGRLRILDRGSTRSQPLANRPISLKTFTYLDDPHTRGTDLPFPITSHAIVTIGTGLSKDKLLQACMRMRMFTFDQHKISFWGAPEVTQKIRENMDDKTTISSRHVLEWVTENSIKNQEQALLSHAMQGYRHIVSSAAISQRNKKELPDHEMIKTLVLSEELRLERLYDIALRVERMSDFVVRQGQNYLIQMADKRINIEYNVRKACEARYVEFLDGIKKLTPASRRIRICGDNNEEYERELEEEKEEERIRQLPPKRDPQSEVPWKHKSILTHPESIDSFIAQAKSLNLHPLDDLFRDTKLDAEWRQILTRGTWTGIPLSKILITRNFLQTVKTSDMDNHLRPVDNILSIQVGSERHIVLISGAEANEICHLLKKGEDSSVKLLNLYFASGELPWDTLTLLRLINGVTIYASDQEFTALVKLLSILPLRSEIVRRLDHQMLGWEGVDHDPETWRTTWQYFHRCHQIEDNGFVRKMKGIKDVEHEPKEWNEKCENLMKTLSQSLFSKNPEEFVNQIIFCRGKQSESKCSDLDKILQLPAQSN